MTNNPKSTFAKRVRAAKPRAKKYDVWDDVISGLGLRVGTSGHRSFFLRRSVRGRIRSATIGSADAMSVPKARAEARRLLATFIEPPRKDKGPRTPSRPMDAFAAEFLDRQAPQWKARTLESNTYMVHKYILPAFGHLAVDAITVEHVKDWFASMADRPGSANRAKPVLSVMMRMAERWGYRPHNSNPCKNAKRYRMQPKAQFLTAEEMARLNTVLTRDEFYCPQAVAIIRLLMLTGCRAGEVVSLEWDWIRGKRIHLPDSKSGPRAIWLSSAARAVTRSSTLSRATAPIARSCFRRVRRRATSTTSSTNGHRIRNEAGLPGLRIHDLRHNWASVAAMNGVDMVTVAKLLGHALIETNERYTICPTSPLRTPPTGCPGALMRPWPEGARSAREGPAMPTVNLTPRPARQSKPQAKDTFLFDRSLPGFGLRIHSSGRKVCIVQARIEGRSRRIVITRHGEMELAEGRRRARDMLALIRAGENPAEDIRREKHTPTLRQFADEYLRRCDPQWKPSGSKTVRIYLKARILPAFGKMPLDRIGPEDVAAWFDAASTARPGAANRAFEILRAMMFRAEEWGLRALRQPLSRHRQEPQEQRRPVPRHRRVGPSWPRARRRRVRMARRRQLAGLQDRALRREAIAWVVYNQASFGHNR